MLTSLSGIARMKCAATKKLSVQSVVLTSFT
jgi:hypothetical protein